jgi:hypothetical protein
LSPSLMPRLMELMKGGDCCSDGSKCCMGNCDCGSPTEPDQTEPTVPTDPTDAS